MTQYGRDTPLYQYLDSVGLLEDALRLRWENFETFTRIKVALPIDVRDDPWFERKVVLGHLDVYARTQFRRLPAFLLTRPSTGNRATSGLMGVMPSAYNAAHAVFFRQRVGPLAFSPCFVLLVLGLVLSARVSSLRTVVGVTLLTLGSFALETGFLTYQDPVLSRYRVEVEPLLYFAALLPLVFMADRLRRGLVGPGGWRGGEVASLRASSG